MVGLARLIVKKVLIVSLVFNDFATLAHAKTGTTDIAVTTNQFLSVTATMFNQFKTWNEVFSFIDSMKKNEHRTRVIRYLVKQHSTFLSEVKPQVLVHGNQIRIPGSEPVSFQFVKDQLVVGYKNSRWISSPKLSVEENMAALEKLFKKDSSSVLNSFFPAAHASPEGLVGVALSCATIMLTALSSMSGAISDAASMRIIAASGFVLLLSIIGGFTAGFAQTTELGNCKHLQLACEKNQLQRMFCVRPNKTETIYNITRIRAAGHTYLQMDHDGQPVVPPTSEDRGAYDVASEFLSKAEGNICANPEKVGVTQANNGRLEIPMAAVHQLIQASKAKTGDDQFKKVHAVAPVE